MTDGARVLEQLRSRVLSGALAAGRRLTQAGLAEDFGVSRIPIRDALQQLAAEGLVTLHGRAGAVVAEVSVADLQELYELRIAIEPRVTRLGVANLGRGDLLQMTGLLETMDADDDPRAWLQANDAFHATLYRRADRPRSVELIETLRRQIERYLHLHLTEIGDVEHLAAEHRRILDAALSGDAALVEQTTRHHLEASRDLILGHLLTDLREDLA